MNNENIKIEYIDIRLLKPNEYNPKNISEKEKMELENSIKEFGIVDPLIINKAKNRNGIIIGGHQRYKIYNKLKFLKVPVVYLDIPDIKKEKELCLRLSKNLGEWDLDLLVDFDESLLKNIGFEENELDNIFGMEIDEEFDLNAEIEKSKQNIRGVKNGDIWQLGKHRLIIGDSTLKENWERLLGEERFDLMFTDPPYRIGYGIGTRKQKTKDGFKLQRLRTYSKIGKTTKEGKEFDEEKSVLKPIFGVKKNRVYLGTQKRESGVPEYEEWLSIANEFQNKKGANVMIFENWKNVVDLWLSVEKYWKICNMIIWHLPNRMQGFSAKHKFYSKYDIAIVGDKNGIENGEYEEEFDDFMQNKGMKFLNSYEIGIYGKVGDSEWYKKENKKLLVEKSGNYAGKIMKSQWSKITDHITFPADTLKSTGQNLIFGTKPVNILIPYLKALSPRNGIVMEPFGGSGSTIIASEIMKRKCRAIEIEPLYGEVIINRWEKFTNQKAKKLK